MSLIPTVVKEYFRKAFVGRTLDEVVEELKQRGATEVSLSGDAENVSDSPICSIYNFYVHYRVKAKDGEWIHFKELADCTYSTNWRKDTNRCLNNRRETLQKALGTKEITIKYVPEKVSSY
jgi:hypothetical protein